MRKLIILSILIVFTHHSYGQGCGLVSGTKDKKTGIETKGGIVSSKDFYSLLIQKRIDPNILNDTLNYLLFLNAASRVMLSDSLVNSKGVFELFLTNGNKIIIQNASCENDPLGFGASIGFSVRTSKSNIERIMKNPIQKIQVFGILETEFSTRKQKQQIKILNCLTKKK
jgi:hypothetical protein